MWWDAIVLPTGRPYCWAIGLPVAGRLGNRLDSTAPDTHAGAETWRRCCVGDGITQAPLPRGPALDPSDRSPLPDGSLLVDALALAGACLQAAS